MAIIKKDIEIAPDRLLRLDLELPMDLPVGRAEIQLLITPKPPLKSGEKPFAGLAGCLKGHPVLAEGGVSLQRRLRDEWDR